VVVIGINPAQFTILDLPNVCVKRDTTHPTPRAIKLELTKFGLRVTLSYTMQIDRTHLATIQAHAENVYPGECFGFLIGSPRQEGTVHQVVAGTNVSDRPARRFHMDALEFVRVEKEADLAGLEVIGFYHSHPDHPAIPSIVDTDRAWSDMFYVIVSVLRGEATSVRLWKLASSHPNRFGSQPVEVKDA
jgi:proteasome lid subunit RPN8/RPN11